MAIFDRKVQYAGRLSEETDFQQMRGASFPGTDADGRRLKACAAAALFMALLAPVLGGGTSAVAEGVLLAGTGLVAAALPARGVRAGFLIGAGLLLVAALDWAWPASLDQLAWRSRVAEAGLPLAWCVSPEPWVSLRAWLLLFAALVWAGWCAGSRWTSRSRLAVCEGLAVGIGGIALVALMARNGHVPGWPAGTGLGPFENRNQTASLFATGAFLTVMCGVERFRGAGPGKKSPQVLAALGCFCLLCVYTAALAVNRSRSGPVLFAGMTLAWALMATPSWRRKPETLAVAVAIALLLGTIFLLTGQSLITRLTANPVMDFRLKIFSDTLGMIRGSPWTGAGLGCFEAIFPIYRNASILQQRVFHPESDWLWLTAETGLPGLLATAGLGGWMGTRVWRGLAAGEERPVRLGLAVACLGLLAHSFADVPGHRLGTMMPALLLLGLAAGGDREEKRWPGSILRGAGMVVLALGAGALAVLALKIASPLVNGGEALAGRALNGGLYTRPGEAEAELERALSWAPLDWRLYVEKAQIEGIHGKLTAALEDFRRARFLEPNNADLPYREGMFWLAEEPRFAIEAWEEALRRTPRAGRPELYQNMLAHAFDSRPELHPALWTLGASNASMELLYFGWASPAEFRTEMDEILHEDPGLSRFDSGQLRRLFPIWMDKGDVARLKFLLARHPEWLTEWNAAEGR